MEKVKYKHKGGAEKARKRKLEAFKLVGESTKQSKLMFATIKG